MRRQPSSSLGTRRSRTLTQSRSDTFFPSPPPMIDLLHPISHTRCMRCIGLEKHFVLTCHRCKRSLCCACVKIERLCSKCDAPLYHPSNIIHRFDYLENISHNCILNPIEEAPEYFSLEIENVSNVIEIRRAKTCLDLLTNFDLSSNKDSVQTLLQTILKLFKGRDDFEVNVLMCFRGWTLTDKFVHNIVTLDTPIFTTCVGNNLKSKQAKQFITIIKLLHENKKEPIPTHEVGGIQWWPFVFLVSLVAVLLALLGLEIISLLK